MKDNNKGFSLVELIVVILIIAIIATALTPQIIKWISTSRSNVDTNNMAEIKLCTETSLAEYISLDGTIPEGGIEFYIRKEGICENASGTADSAIEDGDTYEALAKLIDATMQGDYPEVIDRDDKVYKISIESISKVTVTIVDGDYD